MSRSLELCDDIVTVALQLRKIDKDMKIRERHRLESSSSHACDGSCDVLRGKWVGICVKTGRVMLLAELMPYSASSAPAHSCSIEACKDLLVPQGDSYVCPLSGRVYAEFVRLEPTFEESQKRPLQDEQFYEAHDYALMNPRKTDEQKRKRWMDPDYAPAGKRTTRPLTELELMEKLCKPNEGAPSKRARMCNQAPSDSSKLAILTSPHLYLKSLEDQRSLDQWAADLEDQMLAASPSSQKTQQISPGAEPPGLTERAERAELGEPPGPPGLRELGESPGSGELSELTELCELLEPDMSTEELARSRASRAMKLLSRPKSMGQTRRRKLAATTIDLDASVDQQEFRFAGDGSGIHLSGIIPKVYMQFLEKARRVISDSFTIPPTKAEIDDLARAFIYLYSVVMDNLDEDSLDKISKYSFAVCVFSLLALCLDDDKAVNLGLPTLPSNRDGITKSNMARVANIRQNVINNCAYFLLERLDQCAVEPWRSANGRTKPAAKTQVLMKMIQRQVLKAF